MTGSIDDVVPEWYGIAYPEHPCDKGTPGESRRRKATGPRLTRDVDP